MLDAVDYSKAQDVMLEATDRDDSPWFIIRSDDKRRRGLHSWLIAGQEGSA